MGEYKIWGDFMLIWSVIGLLLLVLIISFLTFTRSAISIITEHVKASKIEDKDSKEYQERMDKGERAQKRMITQIIHIFFIAACFGFIAQRGVSADMLTNILVTFLALHSIIFLHELGHYYFAKRYGLKVDKFTVGVGSKLFSFNRGETEFSLHLYPFLGFVKPTAHNQYQNLRGRKKILFASGGVIVNFILYLVGMVMLSVEKGMGAVYGLKKAFILLIDGVNVFFSSISLDIIYSPDLSFEGQVGIMLGMSDVFSQFWFGFSLVNLLFFILNLVPIAPLDGSKIIEEVFKKIMKELHVPKKLVQIVVGAFVAAGLIFMGSRFVVNNAWDIYNEMQGRWFEFGLWFLLFASVIGYFTQRELEKD